MSLYTENAGAPTMAEKQGQELLMAEPSVQTKRPSFFKVVLLNDDFTPMEFVVHILKALFHKSHEEAISIMAEVHQRGAGICGVYTRDVAETKAELVVAFAREHEHPLQCTVETA